MEEEFNAWYDTEHPPERPAIPGFRSARRWCVPMLDPARASTATYELDSPEVLTTPEYLAHVGDHFTPLRSKAAWGARRCFAAGSRPGVPTTRRRALFISLGDILPGHEAEFNRWYDEEHVPLISQVPGVLRARRFFDPAGKPRYVALYDLAVRRRATILDWQKAVATPWTQRIRGLPNRVERLVRTYPVP